MSKAYGVPPHVFKNIDMIDWIFDVQIFLAGAKDDLPIPVQLVEKKR